MRRFILISLCILFLFSSCSKSRGKESSSPVSQEKSSSPSTSVVPLVKEDEKAVFEKTDGIVATTEPLEGGYRRVSEVKRAYLRYDVFFEGKSVFFKLYEDGEDRALSSLKILTDSYCVKITASGDSSFYDGILISDENGVKNVIEVENAASEMTRSGSASVTIYNDYGTYYLENMDTSSLEKLLYDVEGYAAVVEDAEKLEEKKEYYLALSLLRDYRERERETFEYYGGESYLEKYREDLYQEAIELYRNDCYEEALDAIEECGSDYKDLSILLLNCVRGLVGAFKCGDTLTYGTDENGRRIEWIVVAVREGRVLLLSKDILFDSSYNSYESSTSWENSSIRKYLNDTSPDGFLSRTFSEAELDSILESVIVNADNSVYGTYGGDDTVDRVFLLSLEEITQFSTTSDERVARHDGKAHYWWLRDPGENLGKVMVVSQSGLLYKGGVEAARVHGVRPAMWVSLYRIQL